MDFEIIKKKCIMSSQIIVHNKDHKRPLSALVTIGFLMVDPLFQP